MCKSKLPPDPDQGSSTSSRQSDIRKIISAWIFVQSNALHSRLQIQSSIVFLLTSLIIFLSLSLLYVRECVLPIPFAFPVDFYLPVVHFVRGVGAEAGEACSDIKAE